ncbi:LacI family DNA-binding transcriptional regulator [Paenibacillus apiarius]|uniref:LacI family transcriptional regulator n=1 Tax=Paenibacillus apiarius TaxID=46240 RepID=A0ABT4DZD8_9BACL|nr:LacI family DNA-binding transcriptional regulator [Paenibacillus apiarius]MCY9515188.1 LacI family transcriptional regulator [Paenibacillus apiarius]MCY9522711.1 LacI family transcriptional regulator [Paenibacillus apiarius]MCY9552931.1 LacI family transcriptional regulator [Paenibacillus apiarius]MCY9557652.1 LacI family transcriptional regulator [Paenibacillus apiarius]MCY9681891.1 LacI family transcriptional regulator [Paenibacillus apiarius]
MKSTIYDVAKAAGVSIATVSKVVNQTGNISVKTRERVLHIMKELQYQPSVVASALTGKKTSTFGLLISDLANPFFAEVARNLEDQAQAAGYSIVMCSTDNKDDKGLNYISLLQRKQIDGLIVACQFSQWSLLQDSLNANFPVVLFSKDIPSLSMHTVTVDDYRGGYQAIQHLISLGHSRIGVVTEDSPSGDHRVRGAKQAMNDAGIAVNDDWIVKVKSSIEEGCEGAAHVLQRDTRPTALFTCNDLLAVGSMQSAQQSGLRVPEDLSIIGFDDTILSKIVVPRLTTISQPIQEMAKETVQLLLRQSDTPDMPKQKIVFQPQLVEGLSTQPLQAK